MPVHPHGPRGILNQNLGLTKFQLRRYPPAPDLACFVERYWTVAWDLRGQAPYTQHNIPYPCINLAVEVGRSGVFGIPAGVFSRQLEGAGWVFGVKFKPGAFRPFVQWPIAQLADSVMRLDDVFGAAGQQWEAAMLAQTTTEAWIGLAEDFLRQRLPAPDETVALINAIVECIVADRTITRVDDLVVRFYRSPRTLQRVFQQYVGVSPKWVITRYRLHEAAEQLERGDVTDWPQLALDLGYFDQAHFINDFKAMVGTTPAAYAERVAVAQP